MSADPTHLTDVSNGATSTPKAAKGNAKRATLSSTKPSAAKAGEASFAQGTVDFTKFMEEGRSRLKDAVDKMTDRWDSVRTTAREAGDVLQESNAAAIQGLRDINEQAIENLQSDMDRAFDLMRACAEARSVTDLVQLQNDFLREMFESQMSQTRALSELTMNAARAAFEPLQSGMTQVMEKARKQTR